MGQQVVAVLLTGFYLAIGIRLLALFLLRCLASPAWVAWGVVGLLDGCNELLGPTYLDHV